MIRQEDAALHSILPEKQLKLQFCSDGESGQISGRCLYPIR